MFPFWTGEMGLQCCERLSETKRENVFYGCGRFFKWKYVGYLWKAFEDGVQIDEKAVSWAAGKGIFIYARSRPRWSPILFVYTIRPGWNWGGGSEILEPARAKRIPRTLFFLANLNG